MTRPTPDRRFHRANAHVAHVSLADDAAPARSEGRLRYCTVPAGDLCAAPGGARDKQLRFGQPFTVLDTRDGWAFGFDPGDGYVGYLRAAQLTDGPAPSHRITARASHIYSAPDIKSPEIAMLGLGSLIRGRPQGDFLALEPGGYVPLAHVAPVDTTTPDPASVAETLLGTPYLWGGDSAFGIDCSGLVQLAQHSAGRDCPRDSDLQARHGRDIGQDEPLLRGDVICWKGHVGLMLDAHTLIHANAHHMAVAIEPLDAALTRIAAREFGAVTARRRFA
ncbi:MAG: NlpC/P60 family protein [Marinibacterium sp.]|nr:NlpC/P60 family protein [Marinibacterium sp.]